MTHIRNIPHCKIDCPLREKTQVYVLEDLSTSKVHGMKGDLHKKRTEQKSVQKRNAEASADKLTSHDVVHLEQKQTRSLHVCIVGCLLDYIEKHQSVSAILLASASRHQATTTLEKSQYWRQTVTDSGGLGGKPQHQVPDNGQHFIHHASAAICCC